MKLSAQLTQYLDHCSEKDKEIFLQFFNQLINDFEQIKIERGVRGAIYSFMEMMDTKIEQFLDYENNRSMVQCKSGCDYCCYYQVEISEEEALILVDEIKNKGIEIDWKRVECLINVPREEWYEVPLELRKCPLLSEQGQCQVYGKRPLTCRKHNVVSSPRFCEEKPNELVSGLSTPVIEGIVSAIMSSTKKSDLLVKMLWENRSN